MIFQAAVNWLLTVSTLGIYVCQSFIAYFSTCWP